MIPHALRTCLLHTKIDTGTEKNIIYYIKNKREKNQKHEALATGTNTDSATMLHSPTAILEFQFSSLTSAQTVTPESGSPASASATFAGFVK